MKEELECAHAELSRLRALMPDVPPDVPPEPAATSSSLHTSSTPSAVDATKWPWQMLGYLSAIWVLIDGAMLDLAKAPLDRVAWRLALPALVALLSSTIALRRLPDDETGTTNGPLFHATMTLFCLVPVGGLIGMVQEIIWILFFGGFVRTSAIPMALTALAFGMIQIWYFIGN